MDDLTIVWLIMMAVILHGFANIYFVRWVLWRNEQLSKLLVWYHKNTNDDEEE
jgi:hypothetical protein|tara:strand:+ start:498 stop:656 length:159 start_codon:yes stop_codon:yes gene_type:complete